MMKKANELKGEGNAFYKEKKYQKALGKYTKIFLYINHLALPQDLKQMVGNRAPDTGNVKPEDVKKLQIIANQNCAMCALRQLKFDKSVDFSERNIKALKIDPEAPKARMIRGRARLRLGNLEGARSDLLFAQKHFPKSDPIKSDLSELKKKFKKVRDKQRQQYAGMFDR
eukprot:1364119-Amorphochlora_amoeboformis.AAC.1